MSKTPDEDVCLTFSEGRDLFRLYGQPHERLCSLPVSVLFRVGSAEKSRKMAETGIEPGSRDPESNALDHSAVLATHSRL